MCFYIHEKHQYKKIAKRDITCYKAINLTNKDNIFRSVFQNFKYIMGGIYKTYLSEPKRIGYSIPDLDVEFEINNGFHSYSNKKAVEHDNYPPYVRCIIPKGSEYYYNPEKMEYVSNQIIIKEII